VFSLYISLYHILVLFRIVYIHLCMQHSKLHLSVTSSVICFQGPVGLLCFVHYMCKSLMQGRAEAQTEPAGLSSTVRRERQNSNMQRTPRYRAPVHWECLICVSVIFSYACLCRNDNNHRLTDDRMIWSVLHHTCVSQLALTWCPNGTAVV